MCGQEVEKLNTFSNCDKCDWAQDYLLNSGLPLGEGNFKAIVGLARDIWQHLEKELGEPADTRVAAVVAVMCVRNIEAKIIDISRAGGEA